MNSQTTIVPSFKSLTVAPEVAETPGFADAVQTGNAALAEVVKKHAGEIDVRWTVASGNRERAVLLLTISDATGTKSAVLSKDEFDDDFHLGSRMFKVWGDLLWERLESGDRKLQEAMKALGD